MSRSITLLMWGYQWHFRLAMERRARKILSIIAPELDPKALLVGIQINEDKDRWPVCVEPEDGEWDPKMYFGCAKRTAEIFENHEDHNIFYGDEARMNDKPENIRKKSVWEAVKETTEPFDKQHQLTTFHGWPTAIAGYHVVPMLQFNNSQLQKYPVLPKPIEWNDYKSRESFLHSVIIEILNEASAALRGKDPGRFFDTFDQDKAGILRRAGSSFCDIFGIVTHDLLLQDVFENLNEISSKRYEGSAAVGELLFSPPQSTNIRTDIKLRKAVSLGSTRLARKIIELSGGELCCLCNDAEGISGLGNISNAAAPDVLRVVFTGYYTWDLYYQQKLLMTSSFGVPTLPAVRLQEDLFKSTVRRIFKSITVIDQQRLWSIVEAAIDQKHGTLIVVSEIAEQEAARLSTQSIDIEPMLLTQDLVSRVSGIDGAILVDKTGNCWAIGVILDGMATQEGDPSRGARYNSAVRYVASSKSPVLCLVVSEDGYINMVPTLRPQVRLSEINAKITLLAKMNINNYHDVRNWLEDHRFYLDSEQCEAVNREIIRIESTPREPREMRINTAPFIPDSDMGDSYYQPE